MATKVIFSSELQKFTGEVQTQVQATNYRGVVAEIVAKYPDLAEDEILKMAVAIDGEIVHDLELEKQSGEIFELRSEIEMMVRCIQSGDSPVASAEDGYWSVAMCLAAQASVDQGKPIEFDSFLQSQ